jgi:hypothetical protein
MRAGRRRAKTSRTESKQAAEIVQRSEGMPRGMAVPAPGTVVTEVSRGREVVALLLHDAALIGNHGTARLKSCVFIESLAPSFAKSDDNPPSPTTTRKASTKPASPACSRRSSTTDSRGGLA